MNEFEQHKYAKLFHMDQVDGFLPFQLQNPGFLEKTMPRF